MKRRPVLALAAMVGLGVIVPVWAQRTVDRLSTPETMARTLTMDLREARTLLDRVLSDRGGRPSSRDRDGSREYEANRRQLEDLIDRSARTARDLEEALRRDRRDDRFPPTRGPIERATMTDYQFNEVIIAVRRAKTGGDERRIIEDLARREFITSRQLRSLIPILDQPSNQEEAAVLLYRRLVDPERFGTIRDVLKSSSSWDNITRRLGIR